MIAVVMVNWNGWRDTVAAYASLCRSEHPDWHLFVVDNASSDGSAGQLARLGERTTLIAAQVNAGFAGGCNLGIRAALEAGCEHVFLLNNDAVVRPDTLAMLERTAAATGDGVLGCVVRYRGSGALQYFGSRRAVETGAPCWLSDPADAGALAEPLIATDFVFGAALFAPARLFRTVGLFDERFFLTYEETDWCYRARAAGISCWVVRDAVVEHAGSASLGAATSPLQSYFLQRNRLLFYEKHAGIRLLLRGLRSDLRLIRSGLGRELAGLACGGRIDPRRRALVAAVRDYLLRRFGDCPRSVRALQRSAR